MHRALYLGALLSHAALAQAAFEVASLKPDPFNGSAGRIGVWIAGDMLHVEHQSLAAMVMFAYGIEEFQLSGGPAWAYARPMDPFAYQVIAKAAGAPPKAQFQEMLQTLLAERFQLRVHKETKVLPCYELNVAKNGPKLREPTDPNARTIWDASGAVSQYHGKNVSMQDLVFVLRGQTGRPVIDKTGLPGKYDFELSWAAGDPPPQVTAPSIFTAVQEQLGLRLDSAKAPFDTIVIDGAEKPAQN